VHRKCSQYGAEVSVAGVRPRGLGAMVATGMTRNDRRRDLIGRTVTAEDSLCHAAALGDTDAFAEILDVPCAGPT
jgi:hypothetical protein